MSRIKVRETIASPLSFRDPFRLPYVPALVTYRFSPRDPQTRSELEISVLASATELRINYHAEFISRKCLRSHSGTRKFNFPPKYSLGNIWSIIIIQKTWYKNLHLFHWNRVHPRIVQRSLGGWGGAFFSPRFQPPSPSRVRQCTTKKKRGFARRDTLSYTNARRRTLLPLSPIQSRSRFSKEEWTINPILRVPGDVVAKVSRGPVPEVSRAICLVRYTYTRLRESW